MFELERSSVFFEQMAAAHPTVVQNIEIVNENKIAMDVTYHEPKHFILSLNNLLRSLMFFIENSTKNSPAWLKGSVDSFVSSNQDDYQKLRHLRNVSAHHSLIFPEESLVVGLYRIRSPRSYTLKLGFGDHGKPGKYAWDLALKNTEDIFHDMLSFASVAFIDLEHGAIGECLGITRRWYFKIKFKTDAKRYNEVADVYELASSFSTSLLDQVCNSYAAALNIKFDHSFAQKLDAHNSINTLLELDLFPSLFSEWWEEECEPLNFGVCAALLEGRRHSSYDAFHQWAFGNLTPDVATYKSSLERFAALEPAEILEGNNVADFMSFVLINHWHFKKAFGNGFNKSAVTPSDVMSLQRDGNLLVGELRKEKPCTVASAKQRLDDRIRSILAKLETEQPEE
ncbi:hypothetical protein [Ideonella sp. YS5]|uniref:hypothetical protein n=1 Tax=Ideonella sp. YS5 TaxID=3453714 RepID=UPI003EEA45C5